MSQFEKKSVNNAWKSRHLAKFFKTRPFANTTG